MQRRVILDRAADWVAAWNRGDPRAAVEYVVDDVIWRDVALALPRQGRDSLAQLIESYVRAFPDLRVRATSETVEGSRHVHEWTATGTHCGEFMGIPATGRPVMILGACFLTFDEDARVIEGAAYWNALAVLAQLGRAPGVLGGRTTSPAAV